MFTILAQQPWSRASKRQSNVSSWLLPLLTTFSFSFFSIFVFLSFSLFLLLTTTQAQAATPFTTNGNFSVGSDGSANYSIPIQVPPGTAGMAPTLSLNYSSKGGNGILGMGWGLDGLSQISRCPRTIVQDGAVGGVNYDANDKFCIDGQRLISTGGTYGANGTEYRTETANFAKIVSDGNGGAGPGYFKVWTKSGQIIEYGYTADARIEAAGIATVRTWGVNKISDTKGNYLTVSYLEDNANGEAYVSRVDYTGNAGANLSPYASVQFIYETRPDLSMGYHAGSVMKSTKRMTNIKTYANTSTLVKDYRLSYEQSTATQRSRLKTLTECDGVAESKCKQPLQFNWSDKSIGFTLQRWQTQAYANWDWQKLHFADVNGDGKTDMLNAFASGTYDENQNPYSSINVHINSGASFVTQRWDTNSGGFVLEQKSDVFDANGDGLPDFMNVYGTSYYDSEIGSWLGSMIIDVHVNNGVKFTAQRWESESVDFLQNSYFADVNADGRTDIVDINSDVGLMSAIVHLNTGSGFVIQRWETNTRVSNSTQRWSITDANGDGLPDLICVFNDGGLMSADVHLNTGSSFVIQRWETKAGGFSDKQQWDFSDVNGDGKADLVNIFNDGDKMSVDVHVNTGKAFAIQRWETKSGGFNYKQRWAVSDANGDGLPDLINVFNDGGLMSADVHLNTGLSFVGQRWVTKSGGFSDSQKWSFVDIDGDGKTDLVNVFKDGSGMSVDVHLSSYGLPDMLSNISSGLGASVSLTYSPLTNKSIYTKGVVGEAGTTVCPQPLGEGNVANGYPILNIQDAQYVVSSVSSNDGIGGASTDNYTYGGNKVHLLGRGGLGFRWQVVTEPNEDTTSTTFFRQDYPFIGMPCQTEQRIASSNTLVGISQLTYATSPLTTGSAVSQFPYLTQSIQQSFELGNATAINTTTTTNQYDTYGNVTKIISDSNDGYVKTTTNTYYNDSSNWLLGRLLRSTVSSTSPGTTPTVTIPTAPANPPPNTNVNPTVTLTVPANNSSVATGTAITISATAADSDGTVAKVEFYDGTTLIGTDTSSPYSMSWTNAAVGSHTLTAKATDNANAVTTSSAVTVTITTGTSTPPSTSGLLSQGKTATQSTTLAQPQRGEASRAVDGNTSGAWQWNSDTNSLSHTNSETESQAWWQVDLGASATVSQIKLWNRTDCCGERLADFYVLVSSTDMTNRTLAQLVADNTVSKQQVASLNGAASLVLEMGNVTGRYVRIQRSVAGYLSLAEVQVYGATGSSTPPPPANVNPTVSLTAPTNNGSVATGTAITVSATAADSDGTVAKVEFYDGTTLIGTDTSSPYSMSWTNAAVGSHTLTAKATDNANAVTTSSAVSFSVTTSSSGGATTLLSQGKVTTQSTTLQFGDARRAVDGSTNGNWQWSNQDATNSLSHTSSETESQAWWQVDLGASATVSQIKLWNRTDCCGERLADFYVFVSSTDMTGRTLAQLVADNTVSKQQVASLNGAASLVLEMGNVTGRYVRIQRSGTGYLSLAEVQVYGQ